MFQVWQERERYREKTRSLRKTSDPKLGNGIWIEDHFSLCIQFADRINLQQVVNNVFGFSLEKENVSNSFSFAFLQVAEVKYLVA